jgi:glucosamine--fructose-6-phosphate aminotransferase (isomerizing)
MYVVGCGDSLAAAVAARPWLERLLTVPCEAVQALDYASTLFQHTDAHTALVGLSSSGQTPATVGAVLRARARGAFTIGISNSPRSSLLEATDAGLYVHAERKGWPTQATSGALAVLCLLALEATHDSGRQTVAMAKALTEVPARMQETLEQFDTPMAELASVVSGKTVYLFAGAGVSWGTAQLGAAKVRECTPLHSFAVHLEEYHHYNSQKAGDPLFLIAPEDTSIPRAIDTARAGKAWGGQVYVFSGVPVPAFQAYADLIFRPPTINELLSAFVYMIPLQLFAYHLALALFARAEAQA